MSDLTYDQKYAIPFGVPFSGGKPVQIEYEGCGTHQLRAVGTIELADAQRMYDYLKSLPGIEKT